jgi:predicted dehydrogenase
MTARPRLAPAGATLPRRTFLKGLAATAFVGPTVSLARATRRLGEDKVRLAAIGVGGQGAYDVGQLMSHPHVEMVALCDVDAQRLGEMAANHPEARTFRDYRRLLDAVGNEIDAVLVSTTDFMHAPITLAAMDLGKHVYCQKPLSQNLVELRAMQEMAARKGVVTQMGTQIHGHEAYRTAVAMVHEGAIGLVREAHLWVSKSWAGLPEGIPDRSDPVPEHLDWDLWLGVSPERPYVEGYFHPKQWRRWRNYGTGTLGDMGCHLFDPVFGALELERIRSVVSNGPQHTDVGYGTDGDFTYVFEGTERTDGDLVFRWTDGSGPSRPDASRAQLPEGVELPGAGSFLVGEKGVMVLPHWDLPRFYSDGEPMEIAVESRGSVSHYHEFLDAVRGEGTTGTPFSFAGPVTECVLVGVIAGAFRGEALTWDSRGLRFEDARADALVRKTYREGRSPI